MHKILRIAIIISIIFNVTFLFTEYYAKTYDAGTHLFFADHYKRSWFNTWEPRWYSGFSVTSYPPLPHQVIALFSFAFELEQAFQFTVLILMIIFPITIYEFSKIFVERKAAACASLFASFLPAIIQPVYDFGQYPMLFGSIVVLLATSFFHKYLRSGSIFNLIQIVFLIGIVSCTHVISVFFMILLFFIIFLKSLLEIGTKKAIVIKRSILSVTFGLLLSVIVMFPFILFVFNNPPQTPIPHFSKANIFLEILNGRFDQLKVLGKYYGLTPLLFPLLIIVVYRRRNLVPLFLIGLFFFILSFGGTTPLPSLVFGGMWESLSYGRFALMASICFLPLFGLLCIRLEKKKSRRKFFPFFFLVFILSAIITTYFIIRAQTKPYVKITETEPIAEFLDREEGWNWHYITLGFGRYSLTNLSVTDNFRTLDGFYNQGRSLPILRESGVGFIDGAKFFDNGLTMLEMILENSADYSLKWVFCNDAFYESILYMSGFQLKEEKYNSVTIWEDEDAPAIPLLENEHNESNLFAYIWGILPLLYLSVFLLSLLKSGNKRLRLIYNHLLSSLTNKSITEKEYNAGTGNKEETHHT